MTVVRGAAGVAAVVSAMLVQATVIGPLVYPVPVSLPLLVVVGVAVLSGPSTGITLGFGAGLLADLTSHHPLGLLALTWMGAGIVAGVLGGLVLDPGELNRSSHGPKRRRATHRFDANTAGMSRRRAQALLAGLISVVATGFATLALAVIGSADISAPDQAGSGAFLLLIPAGLILAILAVPLLALIRPVLASPALRPAMPVRLSADVTSATMPIIR
jgi:hypothetical protein